MVGVRLVASSAVHFVAGLRRGQSRQRWYLAALVIRTNFRHHQGSVAVFGSTSKSPVGVTHSGTDYMPTMVSGLLRASLGQEFRFYHGPSSARGWSIHGEIPEAHEAASARGS